MRHRVEPLSHAADDNQESWANAAGTVLLVRRRGEAHWKALVDRVVVVDADRLNGPLAYEALPGQEPDPAMVATTAQGLADRLAVQEHLHVVFDG